jgi:hypothetical protein
LLATLLSLPVLIGGAIVAGSLAAVQTQVIQPGLDAQANANNDATTKLIQSGTIEDLRQAVKGLESVPGSLHKDQLDIVGAIQSVMYEFDANGVKSHNEALIAALKAAIAQRESETAVTPTPGVDRQGAGISAQRPRGEHAGRISNATRAGIILRVIEKTGKAPTADRVTAILEKTRAANIEKFEALQRALTSGDDRIAGNIDRLNRTVAGKDWNPTINVGAPVVNVNTGFTISVRNTRVATSVWSKYNAGGRTPTSFEEQH